MRLRAGSAFALLVLAAALAFSGCGDSDDSGTTAATSATPPEGTVVAPSRPDGAKNVLLIVEVRPEGTKTGFEFEDGRVSGTLGSGTATGSLNLSGAVGKTEMDMELKGGSASWESTGEPQEDGSIAGEWTFTEGTGGYDGIEGGGEFASRGERIELTGWVIP